MKWIPIQNKEQWPKGSIPILLLFGKKAVAFERSSDYHYAIDRGYTHFALIPSLAESEEREKQINNLKFLANQIPWPQTDIGFELKMLVDTLITKL